MTIEVSPQRDFATPIFEQPFSISKMAYNNKRDAAATLSISVRTLDYLIQQGEIKVRRIGSRVVITHHELQRFLRQDHVRRKLQ